MANFYHIGQFITIVLIGTSIMFSGANELLSPLVGEGFFWGTTQADFTGQEKTVDSSTLSSVDQEIDTSSADIVSTIIGTPFILLGQAIDGANLVGGFIWQMLTGWTWIIGGIFTALGLQPLGLVVMSILGAIEGWTIFRFMIIIASVIRGGGG